jgi:hypothetical protein
VEHLLRSFMPWLASILLDVAVEDDVVQDPAHVVFMLIEHSLWVGWRNFFSVVLL